MTWSFEPWIVAPLLLTAVIYARGARESLRRSTHARQQIKREIAYFTAGFVTLALALLSPIHELGEELFSAHMIQHELMMTIAAPLLVLGRPFAPMMWGLPVKTRNPAGRLLSVSVPPLAAFLIHGAAIWVWHAPALYDASVRSEVMHAAQHISFLGTALVFWWSIFHARSRKGSEGVAILYLFLTAIHTTLLGALLTVSDSAIYSVYTDASTKVWGLTAIEDVQLGGLIMWVPGGIAYLAAALYLMLGWLRPSSRRVSQLARTAAIVAIVAALASCVNDRDGKWAAEMTGGSPVRGKEAIRSYGCMSCHSIPGVKGATTMVGPPLAGIADRGYIAGVLSNTPQHMIEWLMNPPRIDSKTAMPNMNVTERDARDIAAYLYTLR
jgi:cytochrome c oxidase assembly factor CtaG